MCGVGGGAHVFHWMCAHKTMYTVNPPLQEDPDIIEGDEEEMAITNRGPTGEELLRERYSITARPASSTSSAQSARLFTVRL